MTQFLDNLIQGKSSTYSMPEDTASINWISLVCFKLSWLGLVVYQNQAVLFSLLMLVACLLSLMKKKFYWQTCTAVFVLGILIDQLLLIAGVFNFGRDLLPAWLIMLWAMFALTLPHGFSFIARLSPTIQVVIGILSGMLSYSAGMKLGAVQFPIGISLTLLVLGGLWGVLLPLFFIIHSRLKQ